MRPVIGFRAGFRIRFRRPRPPARVPTAWSPAAPPAADVPGIRTDEPRPRPTGGSGAMLSGRNGSSANGAAAAPLPETVASAAATAPDSQGWVAAVISPAGVSAFGMTTTIESTSSTGGSEGATGGSSTGGLEGATGGSSTSGSKGVTDGSSTGGSDSATEGSSGSDATAARALNSRAASQ